MLKYLVSFVKLINYLIKSFLLTVYLMVHLCGYLLTVYLMVHLWGYLWYGIYISKTYFKKFSYNKDIKINIL